MSLLDGVEDLLEMKEEILIQITSRPRARRLYRPLDRGTLASAVSRAAYAGGRAPRNGDVLTSSTASAEGDSKDLTLVRMHTTALSYSSWKFHCETCPSALCPRQCPLIMDESAYTYASMWSHLVTEQFHTRKRLCIISRCALPIAHRLSANHTDRDVPPL